MNKDYLIEGGENCKCGKEHILPVKEIIVESGAILKLPELIKNYNSKRPFILADKNTFMVAGKKVTEVLEKENIPYSKYVFEEDSLEPDERAVGSAIMHYDSKCDMVIGVGSGVINDISKIVANVTNNTYVIVATAPSMDGYASATSSMSMDGLKVSLSSKCAEVIIGDLDILKQAPLIMLTAGLGDMLAKYISICEWRIANEILGEYYCENVAELVRKALNKCVTNAEGLLRRDEQAVKAVFEGLIIGGVAMAYAGVSRPASGVEHYISHVADMRGLEFGTKTNLHGIQCAVGTLIASRIYERVLLLKPNKEKALKFVDEFNYQKWAETLKEFLGKGALAMIKNEEKDGKYDKKKHAERLDIIMQKWDKILSIIKDEIPASSEIEKILTVINCPKTLEESGITCDENLAFKATKDIRDKYVVSRLLWDLGEIEQIKIV